MGTCPICNFEAELIPLDNDGPLKVSCNKCGTFIFTKEAHHFYEAKIKEQTDLPSKLSHWIRTHQGDKITIDIIFLRKFPTDYKLPNPFEQANNLILWLGNNLGDNYGDEVELDVETLTSIIGSKTIGDVEFILKHLDDEGYIHAQPTMGTWSCGLSFKGWAKFDELNKPTSKTKVAFMAMKYNDPELDDIYQHHVKEAVKQTGFEIDLLKDVLKAGSIDDQLRVQIKRAKFLISELTHGNYGAYWEAGYADGLSKPVIYMCKKSVFDDPEKKPHFDTNHLATVTWEKETIVDDMKNLKGIIRNTFWTEAIMEDKNEE